MHSGGESCVERFNGILPLPSGRKSPSGCFCPGPDRRKAAVFTLGKDGFSLPRAENTAGASGGTGSGRRPRRGGDYAAGSRTDPGLRRFPGYPEVEAGCCGYFDGKEIRLRRYWRLEDREHRDTFPQTLEHVRSLVTDAIRRQLVSDVPVCTFLSGGLDSSLISSVAAREEAKQGRRLHTFSVDYKDNAKYFHAGKFQPNSDPEFIEIMTQYLDTEHHWVILDTQELADALYEAVEARDLPGMADVDASLLLFVPGHEANGNRRPVRRVCRRNFRGYPWYRDPEVRERAGFPWFDHCVAQFLPLRPVQSRPRSGVLRFSPV